MTEPKLIELSKPQIVLLTDIATHPQMFIHTYMKWHRTAQALRARGLAYVVDEHRFYDPYQIRITETGRQQAVLRGILNPSAAHDKEPDRG